MSVNKTRGEQQPALYSICALNMVTLNVIFLLGFACCVQAFPHGGKHWRDLKDERWEEPQGRIFPVSTSSEINALQDELQPGDAMIMAPGDWDGPRIDLTASGRDEPGYKIYLMPEIYGETRFVGSCRLYMHGQYQEVRGLWLDGEAENMVLNPILFEMGSSKNRLTNSVISYYNRAEGDAPGKHNWVRLWGSYHTLDWNEFVGKETYGEMIQVRTETNPPPTTPDSYGHIFKHNYFGPRAITESGDDGEGIQIGLFESEHLNYECVVEFNLFDNYDGEIECISVKSSNNTIRFNTFRESACTITLRHTNNTRVEENYFLCGGKDRCGGLRVHGERHVILNNYIEDSLNDRDDIGGIVLYAGDSTEPKRKLVKDVLIERNVMTDCSRCIIAGSVASTGGDQFPENINYINNIMTSRTASDWVLKETQQANPYFEGSMGWVGVIDNEEGYAPGLRREDPMFEYDSELDIQVPTAADFDFTMSHPPLQKQDVGTTWYDARVNK